jgi:glycosyltransferase involved in cell wall biosynthesis
MSAPRDRMMVLVPCLNEEHNIATTVAEIQAVGQTLPVDVEVHLIDDGSTDGTRGEIERLCRDHGCTATFNAKNKGVGRSLLDAYDRIPAGTWVTIMPGDNEIQFSSIADFVAMRDQYDIILGYLQNPIIRPLGRRLVSFGYTKLVKTLYGFPFRYLNGMKLFRVDAFKGIEVRASGHAFNSELLAKAMLRNPRLRIGEAPFIARGRATGASKAIRPRSVIQALREVGAGMRLVAAYRDEVIAAGAADDDAPADQTADENTDAARTKSSGR